MYIRLKSTPKSPRKSMQIVEGYRDSNNKVKQRIVRHLGVVHNDAEEAQFRALGESIIAQLTAEREASSSQVNLFSDSELPRRGRPKKKRLEDILPVDKVTLDDIEEVDRVVEGVHEVGGFMYQELGFDSLLSKKRDKEILEDVVLSRMVSPDSKRGLQKLLSEQFDKDHDLDAIYRMMDKLHEEIPSIKRLCFESTRSLLPNQETDLVFFDVTTLYFESIETDGLRGFGYSKDHRFNTTQLVLALATDEKGLPIGYELFSGNTAEVKTLLASIKSWESFLKIKDVCFIADRAMFSKENMALLDASGYRYIVAAKLHSLKGEIKEQVLSVDNYDTVLLGNQLAWISDIAYEGKRLITSYKSSRAKNDVKSRQKIIEKIEKTLGKNGNSKKLVSNSGVKKYTFMQDSQAHLDESKIAEDENWDGLHGVITNDTTITPQEAIAKYARLWVIEESFRTNKHHLKMRPIFHYTKKRIESHIAICYMSFALLRHMEYRVALTQKMSPKEIMKTLLSVQASIHKHKRTKDLYRMPGVFNKHAQKIYKAFDIKRSRDAQIYVK